MLSSSCRERCAAACGAGGKQAQREVCRNVCRNEARCSQPPSRQVSGGVRGKRSHLTSEPSEKRGGGSVKCCA